jgi:phage-related protein
MTPPKKVAARFYASNAGDEPVRRWLKSLSREDCRTIGTDIQIVEFGWPVGLPVCRPLGNGLWEVRSDISDKRIARVIFGFHGGEIILLHGFIKKTQKTPRHDIDLAAGRFSALRDRTGE